MFAVLQNSLDRVGFELAGPFDNRGFPGNFAILSSGFLLSS